MAVLINCSLENIASELLAKKETVKVIE